jgi:TetR/AcrR family transcriptional regulator, transcriptional repressor for nem operon
MRSKIITKQDTKTALLHGGIEIMLEKGYSNTGIQEVLAALDIPKGSFYYYFESKEDFAICIIRQFDQECTAKLLKILQNAHQLPIDRLKSYCESAKQDFLSQQCRKGCLIGNLSQEMSDQSEVLRKELASVTAKRLAIYTRCFADGQQSGEIRQDCSTEKLAEVFMSGWNGAIMQAKTVKSIKPLESFIELMFEHFLKPQKRP